MNFDLLIYISGRSWPGHSITFHCQVTRIKHNEAYNIYYKLLSDKYKGLTSEVMNKTAYEIKQKSTKHTVFPMCVYNWFEL